MLNKLIKNFQKVIKGINLFDEKWRRIYMEVSKRVKEDLGAYWCGEKKTSEELEIMMKEIGYTYRICKQRMKLHDSLEWGGVNDDIYRDDRELVMVVDLSVENCPADEALVLRREYLMDSEKNWFIGFLSKSQFYRLKKKAVKEFFDHLIIRK